jgi:hypothetical protein
MRKRRVFLIADTLVVGTQLTLALFVTQKSLAVPPSNDEVLRFDVVDETRIGLDPLDLPLLTPNVLQYSNMLQRCVTGPRLPEPILLADLDL